MALDAMPDSQISRMKASLRSASFHGWSSVFQAPKHLVAAIHEVDFECAKVATRRTSAVIERSVYAHVVLDWGAAPTMESSWEEFADPDMEATTAGMGFGGTDFDARSTISFMTVRMPGDKFDGYIEKLEKLLKLSDKVPACDVAAERISMARHRLSAGNKAIDGCISLEALLGDNHSGEISYKIALRAALLLGGETQRKQHIRKAVKAFYVLRSKSVHGKHEPKPIDQNCARDGVSICAEVLRKIVENGSLPDWPTLELQSGLAADAPPFLRLREKIAEQQKEIAALRQRVDELGAAIPPTRHHVHYEGATSLGEQVRGPLILEAFRTKDHDILINAQIIGGGMAGFRFAKDISLEEAFEQAAIKAETHLAVPR